MIANDPKRVFITGASGAGVSTFGRALAHTLDLPYLDVDDFYWLPTDPPFTIKRPIDERITMILAAQGDGEWILGGSCDGWGDPVIEQATSVIFIDTPHDTRMARLKAREKLRYGARILPGGDMHENHMAFLEWASKYDNPPPDHAGRSRPRHEAWLAGLARPIHRLDGTQPVEKLVAQITNTADSEK